MHKCPVKLSEQVTGLTSLSRQESMKSECRNSKVFSWASVLSIWHRAQMRLM